MRTTRNYLNELLAEIARRSGQATSSDEAIMMNKEMYLYLEHNSIYGGYRVVNVKVKNGAHYGAFGGNSCEDRLAASEMRIKLESILSGLDVAIALTH